jgi:hypothetical protein
VSAARLDDAAIHDAFAAVFTRLIAQILGAPWARKEEMAEQFGDALA